MLRVRLNDDLKVAVKSQEKLAVSTLRLVLAALKDRDIAARAKGNCDGIDLPLRGGRAWTLSSSVI